MHSISHLDSMLFVLLACLLSALLLYKLKQPSFIAFILGGVLLGPNMLKIVPYENVELLSEIGVGLIMFTIGLELSLHKLIRVKFIAILGGSIQLTVSILLTFLFANIFQLSQLESFIIGCVIAFSSTTVVLNLLSKKGELTSTHGNISTGILLYQDIIAVPIIAFLPILSYEIDINTFFILSVLGRSLAYIFALYISARILVPKILHLVVQTNNKELFSISVFAICLCIAAIGNKLGISLALGAFLAGLIVSEGDFGNQANSEILPLKESFGAIFFAGMGMIFNPAIFYTHTREVILSLFLIIPIKIFLLFAICILFRYAIKTSVNVSIRLSQIGEFSLLLLITAFQAKLINENIYQILIANSILSIILSPYLITLIPKFNNKLEFLEKWKYLNRSKKNLQEEKEEVNTNHIVVCGYGPTSSIILKKLNAAKIKTITIDLNYKTVKSLRKKSYNAIYGDSSSEHILKAANIKEALLVIASIPDPSVLKVLVKKIKKQYPFIPIFARVKYESQKKELLQLGAEQVIWEEWEAGITMAKKIAQELHSNPKLGKGKWEALMESLEEDKLSPF